MLSRCNLAAFATESWASISRVTVMSGGGLAKCEPYTYVGKVKQEGVHREKLRRAGLQQLDPSHGRRSADHASKSS